MSVIAFPKSNLRDPAVIRHLKKEIDCCERCGVPKEYAVLEAAHIVGRSTGPDMRENIVILCGPASAQQGCHGDVQDFGDEQKERICRIVSKGIHKVLQDNSDKLYDICGRVPADLARCNGCPN